MASAAYVDIFAKGAHFGGCNVASLPATTPFRTA